MGSWEARREPYEATSGSCVLPWLSDKSNADFQDLLKSALVNMTCRCWEILLFQAGLRSSIPRAPCSLSCLLNLRSHLSGGLPAHSCYSARMHSYLSSSVIGAGLSSERSSCGVRRFSIGGTTRQWRQLRVGRYSPLRRSCLHSIRNCVGGIVGGELALPRISAHVLH